MDDKRKDRLLQDMKSRFRDAQLDTKQLTEETWDELDNAGLGNILASMDRLSSLSPEYQQMKEAVVLLHPYREAWLMMRHYHKEILESPEDEQKELLGRVLDMILTNTRIRRPDLLKHIYVFWPVPEHARMAV